MSALLADAKAKANFLFLMQSDNPDKNNYSLLKAGNFLKCSHYIMIVEENLVLVAAGCCFTNPGEQK